MPGDLSQTLAVIQMVKVFQKLIGAALLAESPPAVNLWHISGVEGNPQEHKAAIRVGFLFGAVEQAEGAADAQPQVVGVAIPLPALTGFECAAVRTHFLPFPQMT